MHHNYVIMDTRSALLAYLPLQRFIITTPADMQDASGEAQDVMGLQHEDVSYDVLTNLHHDGIITPHPPMQTYERGKLN